MSRMRFIGIGGCGDGAGESCGGCGGRNHAALAACDLGAADVAAADVLNQFEQMAVLNLLDAVGKSYKSAINLNEFSSLKLVSQLFSAQSQRVVAGVLAQHQP